MKCYPRQILATKRVQFVKGAEIQHSNTPLLHHSGFFCSSTNATSLDFNLARRGSFLSMRRRICLPDALEMCQASRGSRLQTYRC